MSARGAYSYRVAGFDEAIARVEGAEGASDIARKLEESAQVMEACEQQIADDFKRIGGRR